jgi:hypothetical protein
MDGVYIINVSIRSEGYQRRRRRRGKKYKTSKVFYIEGRDI